MSKGAAFGKLGGVLEGAAKSTRDAASAAAKAGKQSKAVQEAGTSLGKMARFAAYPAGLGLGVGAGGYFAGMGISGGVGQVKDTVMPKDEEKDGGALRTLISVAVLLLLGYGAVKLYTMVKAAG
ncbi:MAG TPA: hypothetical protein PKV78_05370 [Methanoculleus thermophilus]|jgi:hypothetical protein|nr:hypothetical protein [Bacillota bacterium]HQD25956.1 hypothetical protein [Methanoculleus thermophilus]